MIQLVIIVQALMVLVCLWFIVMRKPTRVIKRELNTRQVVNLCSSGDIGGLLREITIEFQPLTIYPNQVNAYRVTFPFETQIILRFADGCIHTYSAFNGNIQDIIYADWAKTLTPLVQQYTEMRVSHIPEFLCGNTTFKLASIGFDVELPMEYCNPLTGEVSCETSFQSPGPKEQIDLPFSRPNPTVDSEATE